MSKPNPENSLCAPIIIIGSGPVGVAFANKLLDLTPDAHVTLLSNEPYVPYDRVQLSSLLAGHANINDIALALPDAEKFPNFRYATHWVTSIDTAEKKITDKQGIEFHYSALIIATGSRAHIPNIPNIDSKGVYTFRNMKDAEHLYSRLARSRHTVVVGGGLLGIEAAKGLRQLGTEVTLVQQGEHLMNRQLDPVASERLKEKVESLGINTIINSGVRDILINDDEHSTRSVTAITTNNGETLACDTLLVCAGITPNTELAKHAGIQVRKGIVVNDKLQTSHENIYAIGECCEHQQLTYGLVSPGLEQASVLAHHLAGKVASYQGSLTMTRLKVIGQPLFSLGEVNHHTKQPFLKSWIYKDQNTYRRIITVRHKIVGAVGYGDWPELARLQESFKNQTRLSIFSLWRFKATGSLWNSNEGIMSWPATTQVCQCKAVTLGALIEAKDQGCPNAEALSLKTGAGTVCGSCKPLLVSLYSPNAKAEKESTAIVLGLTSLLALVLIIVFSLIPASSVSDSVQTQSWFEHIWNDKFWKQVTGFTLLGLSIIGLLMSLRKRVNWAWMGKFSHWRIFHICLGVLCSILLFFHTGAHMGHQLNRLLMIDFLSIICVGAFTGAVIACSHRLSVSSARLLRKTWSWLHIIISWPLPALLAIHILTTYYF